MTLKPMMLLHVSLIFLLGLVGFTGAQQSGWQANQVNATMCQWQLPRAAVIRDTLYLDGGYLSWEPGMSDGSYWPAEPDDNPLGLVYMLNFSQPFNTSQNFSQILKSIFKGSNGDAANDIGPEYYDGAMLANDGEFYTYGGLLANTDEFPYDDASNVLGYQKYWYGNPGKVFTPGFLEGRLSSGVTRYVTGGASVSVPSENLGFYFSGLKSASAGPIFYPNANESIVAEYISDTLIALDMSSQGSETWTNHTLPNAVPGRSNAEIVWIPIGERGILVALGGVVDPEYAFMNLSDSASQMAQSQATSPTFMSTVAVYDIQSGSWYMQATNGVNPGALTQGCTVVASAQDGSSHNIYWYGGFDGINPDKSDAFSDDVWILSIPSFMWMKVTPGKTSHARAGHRCVKPYPDQMLVIGGYTASSGNSPPICVADNIVQVYNLSSTDWITSYDPNVWSNYIVPEMIYDMVGGNPLGGATETAPTPAWANSSMPILFSTAYNTSKITEWYPYASLNVANNTRPNAPKSSGSSNLPSWVAPVLGVVLGLVFLSAIAVAFILWRRRKFLRAQSESGMGTADMNRYRIISWVRGADTKAVTVTSEDAPSSPYDDLDSTAATQPTVISEAGSSQVHEMPDSSAAQELHGTGMSYIPPGKYSAHPNGLKPTASASSRISRISRKSESSNSDQLRMISPLSPRSTPRPDSPSLGSEDQPSRMVSGVSSIDTSHLRGVDLVDDGPVSPPLPPETPEMRELYRQPVSPTTVSPPAVSPPSPHGSEQEDYLTGSPRRPNMDEHGKRKSNFGEILEEK